MIENAAVTFEKHRGRLTGLAYRMLGSRADAEDVVQEAYVRWHQAEPGSVENPEAWLVTATSRLAIDRLRRLKTEREAYVGPWLPEPIVAPAPPDRNLELSDDLSIAFLALLERLAPEERAAFLLHDVFDVGYREIASVIERSEAACRQVVHRARERVRGEHKRFDVDERVEDRVAAEIHDRRWRRGTSRHCSSSLRPTPPGRRTAAARLPRRRARSSAPTASPGSSSACARSSGPSIARSSSPPSTAKTGLCIRDGERLTATMSIATDGQRILAVYAVVNPDKLH